jgi:hypothetical protein
MDTNSAIECASMESILGSEKSDLEVLEKQRRSSRKQTSSNSSVGSLGTDGSSVMRKTTTNSRWDDIATYEAKGRLEDFVMSSRFETFFAFLIMLNMVVMIVEEQFEGSVMGFELAWYEKYGSPAYNQEYMPAAKQSFDLIELIFATVFTIEAGLRMAGRGFAYWRDKSELMDLFIVVCSNVSLLAENYASVDITLFRVLRLAKLLRIVKLIRTVEQLDSLQLMTTALYASINALCWAVVLLFIMQSFVALILTSIFRSEYLEGDSLTPEQKRQLFEYFGTYARSMLSTFELMLANWPPICRFLSESLHEGWSVVVVVYKLTFGFAFVGVINSVFMQETLNVAVTDDNIMIKTKTRATAIHRRKMEKLLKLADTNKDGFLSLAEFEAVLHNPGVKTWLESMDLETRDGKLLFHLLDKNGDDKLSVDELTQGTGRLKGIARSIDTQVIIRALLQQWFPDVRKEDGEGALVNIQSDVFAPRGAESKSCMRLSPKSGMAIGKSTDM